jgi:hypothetical protein
MSCWWLDGEMSMPEKEDDCSPSSCKILFKQPLNLFNSNSPYSHIINVHNDKAKLAKRLKDCLFQCPQKPAHRSWQKQQTAVIQHPS